jgi:pimeloyl-ACP methyl ester carboxylesterase
MTTDRAVPRPGQLPTTQGLSMTAVTAHTRATPTFVFVHGSASNSFSWGPVARELTLRGHRSVALDLPGHGLDAALPLSYQAPQDLAAFSTEPSPLAGITLQDCVDHVVAALRRVAPYGPAILVGQSMGGLTLTGTGNAAPELVARLVYITAFCPVELPSVMDYMTTPEAAASLLGTVPGVGDPARTGASRNNWRSADPEFLRAAKAALMPEATDAQFRTALNYGMQPDESVQLLFARMPAEAGTWGTIPRSYIRATEDRAVPSALQDRMIAEADALTPDNKFDVHSVAASHGGILLCTEELADILCTLVPS